MKHQDIESKINKLPEHVISEINDFIDFLLDKYGETETEKSKFSFNWEGGLNHIKDQYTSVELQHKSNEWR